MWFDEVNDEFVRALAEGWTLVQECCPRYEWMKTAWEIEEQWTLMAEGVRTLVLKDILVRMCSADKGKKNGLVKCQLSFGIERNKVLTWGQAMKGSSHETDDSKVVYSKGEPSDETG